MTVIRIVFLVGHVHLVTHADFEVTGYKVKVTRALSWKACPLTFEAYNYVLVDIRHKTPQAKLYKPGRGGGQVMQWQFKFWGFGVSTSKVKVTLIFATKNI
jgi:hypothetical protein